MMQLPMQNGPVNDFLRRSSGKKRREALTAESIRGEIYSLTTQGLFTIWIQTQALQRQLVTGKKVCALLVVMTWQGMFGNGAKIGMRKGNFEWLGAGHGGTIIMFCEAPIEAAVFLRAKI